MIAAIQVQSTCRCEAVVVRSSANDFFRHFSRGGDSVRRIGLFRPTSFVGGAGNGCCGCGVCKLVSCVTHAEWKEG